MSVVVNARDVLLQAAPVRLGAISNSFSVWLTKEAHTVPADAAGVVSSYAGATGDFKVISNGTDISSNFTLSTQANPQALAVGYVGRTFTVTGGLDAGEDSATLTIRATGSGLYASVLLDKVFSLGKSKTGAPGPPGSGSPGTRGTVHVYGTASAWFDTTANSAITAFTGSATRITGDVATLSDATAGFAQTKYWDGSAWQVLTQVFDGALVVVGTITTDALVTNAATAASSVIDFNLSTSLVTTNTSQSYITPTLVSLATTGAPVKVIAHVGIRLLSSNAALHNAYITAILQMDTVDQHLPASSVNVASPGSSQLCEVTLPVVWRGTPSAANHDFRLKIQINANTSAGGSTTFATNTFQVSGNLIVEENKV